MSQFLAQLRTIGTQRLYRKGSTLFFQGEVPNHAIIILDGVVKAFTLSSDGEESIANLYGRGSVLPIAWLNNQSPTSLFHYEAIKDTRALSFTKEAFETLVYSQPDLMREYLMMVSKSQAGLLLRVTGLCQARAVDKVCYALYYLMFRYGIEKQPGIYEIDLKLTQGMLANMIGQTRESTAKNLKTIKEHGIVDYTTSIYRIDKRKLEHYMDEDGFEELDTSL